MRARTLVAAALALVVAGGCSASSQTDQVRKKLEAAGATAQEADCIANAVAKLPRADVDAFIAGKQPAQASETSLLAAIEVCAATASPDTTAAPQP